MGCGCGKKGSAERMHGSNPTDPIVFGLDNVNLPVKRVRLVQGSMGVPAGATRYVRGEDVDTMIGDGRLRPVDR